MASKLVGLNAEIFQGNESGQVDRFGILTLTWDIVCPMERLPQLINVKGSPHPIFTSAEITKASFQVLPGRKMARITYACEGSATGEGGSQAVPEPYYEFAGSLGIEPIEAHPKIDEIAGSAAYGGQNGAIWVDIETGLATIDNSRAVLKGFTILDSNGIKNAMAGVDSFEDPRGVWTAYTFQRNKPTDDLAAANKIVTPPGGAPVFAGRNYKSGMPTYSKRGGIYQISTPYVLSGEGGWNKKIYKEG